MNDCVNRRCAKASWHFVSDECEFQPASAKQVPRFKRGCEGETAPGNPYSASRTIGSGTAEFSLLLINHFKEVIRMIRDDAQRVAGPHRRQIQFICVLVGVLFHETLPIRGHYEEASRIYLNISRKARGP
jgi:hypothetical protein